MKKEFLTIAEAEAFKDGIEYVGDIDVDASEVFFDDGFWCVVVTVGNTNE